MTSMEVIAELIGATIANANAATAPAFAVPDIDLPDDWKAFEETLGRFKKEYIEAMNMYAQKERELRELRKVQTLVRRMAPSDIRSQMMAMIESYNQPEDELVELAGKVKAMERVLIHTNAHRYTQFTCPVCIDRLSNIFLDPCGHLICDACLNRTHQTACPTCRTEITPKRIYTSM